MPYDCRTLTLVLDSQRNAQTIFGTFQCVLRGLPSNEILTLATPSGLIKIGY